MNGDLSVKQLELLALLFQLIVNFVGQLVALCRGTPAQVAGAAKSAGVGIGLTVATGGGGLLGLAQRAKAYRVFLELNRSLGFPVRFVDQRRVFLGLVQKAGGDDVVRLEAVVRSALEIPATGDVGAAAEWSLEVVSAESGVGVDELRERFESGSIG